MELVYLLLAIYLITPIAAALTTKLPYPSQSSSFQERLHFWYALTILIGIYLMLLAVGYKRTMGTLPFTPIAIIAAIIATPTMLLTYSQWKSSNIYVNHKSIFGIALAYLTLWIFNLSQKIADTYVSQNANISPTELPTAINGLALLYAPIWWGIALSVALLVPYTWALAKVVLPARATTRNESTEEQSERKEKIRQVFLNIAHAVGLALTTFIILEAIPIISRTSLITELEMKIFVSSGFPLKSTDCFKSTSTEDRFSILSSGEILVAKSTTDSKSGKISYDISKESCKEK